MSRLTWTTEKRRLGDLTEWDKNPRQLSKHDEDHLGESIDKFGLADPLVINTNNQIIGGHQRKKVMLANGYTVGSLVDVRVPSRPLTEKEAEELAIRLNRNSGEWDFDILADFELDDLTDWGFTLDELQAEGIGLDLIEFPEYDEGIENEVEYHECPECGHQWPK